MVGAAQSPREGDDGPASVAVLKGDVPGPGGADRLEPDAGGNPRLADRSPLGQDTAEARRVVPSREAVSGVVVRAGCGDHAAGNNSRWPSICGAVHAEQSR